MSESQLVLFHTSVKTRVDDPSLEYKPRAWYELGTEIYVLSSRICIPLHVIAQLK